MTQKIDYRKNIKYLLYKLSNIKCLMNSNQQLLTMMSSTIFDTEQMLLTTLYIAKKNNTADLYFHATLAFLMVFFIIVLSLKLVFLINTLYHISSRYRQSTF